MGYQWVAFKFRIWQNPYNSWLICSLHNHYWYFLNVELGNCSYIPMQNVVLKTRRFCILIFVYKARSLTRLCISKVDCCARGGCGSHQHLLWSYQLSYSTHEHKCALERWTSERLKIPQIFIDVFTKPESHGSWCLCTHIW